MIHSTKKSTKSHFDSIVACKKHKEHVDRVNNEIHERNILNILSVQEEDIFYCKKSEQPVDQNLKKNLKKAMNSLHMQNTTEYTLDAAFETLSPEQAEYYFCVHTKCKGQLISEANCQFVNSSKKRKN